MPALAALFTGWPFPAGVDPTTATLTNPTPTFVGGTQPNWQVPSGKWWLPLLFATQTQCGGGAPPWTTFEIIFASAYWGGGNNAGASNPATIFHVGFSPQPIQQVHLTMAVGLDSAVMAPADATQLAYASASLPPALLGPADNVRMVFFDKGGTILTADQVNFAVAEYDSAGADTSGPTAAPLPTPLLP